MSRHSPLWLALVVLTMVFIVTQVSAQESPPSFPGALNTRHVAELKRDADRAYERGDYERAYRIYSKGLAWRGDKYSQYMVGLMRLRGEGVGRDPALGAAWLQLAAQRNQPPLAAAYDEALATLSAAQKERSQALHADLEAEYGDRKVLARLIRRDRRTLRRMTGSRVGADDFLPLSILTVDGRRLPPGQFYGSVRQRLQARYDYLGGVVELGEFELIDDEPTTDEPAVPGERQ